MRSLLVSIALALASGSARAQPINGVIGDASYVAIYGHAPGPGVPERERIRAHLRYVERRLRAAPSADLDTQTRAARSDLLDTLHAYWRAGRFPKNERAGGRRPHFVDAEGTRCAVAHLIEHSGHHVLMERVRTEHEWDLIAEMRTPGLADWATHHGFTLSELAMIQPTYPGYKGPGYTEPWPRTQAFVDGVTAGFGHRLSGCVDARPVAVRVHLRVPASEHSDRVQVQAEVSLPPTVEGRHRASEKQLACMREQAPKQAQGLLGWIAPGPQLDAEAMVWVSKTPLTPRRSEHLEQLVRRAARLAYGRCAPRARRAMLYADVHVAAASLPGASARVAPLRSHAPVPAARLACLRREFARWIEEAMPRVAPGEAFSWGGDVEF